jgi:hypothetical protein
MSVTKTGIKAHDDAVAAAEGKRQSAVAAASSQAAVISAEVSFYQTVKASDLANGVSTSVHSYALRSLGQTG